MHCTDQCTSKSFIEFNHTGLQQSINKLQSSLSQELMQDTFKDLFEGVESLQSMEFLQTDAEIAPLINKTKFNNPPVPRTKVPGNPCNDPFAGGVSDADKAAAKCTIKKSPQCFKLQSRFLAIQGGIADERDQLLEDIDRVERDCEEQKKTLETAIKNDQDLLATSNVKLAAATEKESTAGEIARQTNKQNDQYNADLVKQMKKCSTNYITFETELCALKKIR